jgi:hypothetical protein
MMSSGINGRPSRADEIEVFDTAGASVFDPLAAADVAALINDRLDKTADLLVKLAGDTDDAAWSRSMAHTLHSDAAITAELAKQRPRTPVIPMGMPIGETSWLEDEWMGTP